jgi:hypothetical protein
LRTGAEYGVAQARWLHRQLGEYDCACLTNLPGIPGIPTARLKHDWPGWWSKMEIFDPDGPFGHEDIFFLDIDTLLVGSLEPLFQVARAQTQLVMISDFYHGASTRALSSSVLWVPAAAKANIWGKWIKDPEFAMSVRRLRGWEGDQGFIASASGAANTAQWDQLLPGAIVSYKRHIAAPGAPGHTARRSLGKGRLPKGALVVCFHGQPRPWAIAEFINPIVGRDFLLSTR